jgi:bifunctional non-homologous end joining protein LigD
MLSRRSRRTSFSTESWSPSIHRAGHHSRSCKMLVQRGFQSLFTPFNLLNRNGELLTSLLLSERRKTLEILFTRTPDALRLSPLLEAPSGQILEAVRKLGLEGVVGKRIDSC